MLGARPGPINLSLMPQLALDLVPSAPPARAGSCMGRKLPKQLPNLSVRFSDLRARQETGGSRPNPALRIPRPHSPLMCRFLGCVGTLDPKVRTHLGMWLWRLWKSRSP